MRGSGLLDPIVLWGENVFRQALPTCQNWLGSVDPRPRYGVQTCENRYFTSPAHGFVIYCAKLVCSILSCLGAKM